MKFFARYVLLFPLFLSDLTYSSDSNTVPQTLSQTEADNHSNTEYLFHLGIVGYMQYLFEGKESVLPTLRNMVAKDTLKNGLMKALSVVSGAQRKVFDWSFGFFESMYNFRNFYTHYTEKYPKSEFSKQVHSQGFLPYFLKNSFLPQFTRSINTGLICAALVKTFRLNYPQFVRSRWWMMILALELSVMAKECVGSGYDLLVNSSQ